MNLDTTARDRIAGFEWKPKVFPKRAIARLNAAGPNPKAALPPPTTAAPECPAEEASGK